MSAARAARRWLSGPAQRCALVAAFALGAPTCRPRYEGPVGYTPSPSASASASADAAPPSPWAPPALGPPLAPVDVPPFRALGHAGGRYEVRLWSSDAAAYRAGGALPPGLVVCAEHREGAEPSDADLTTCMRREPRGGEGAWLFGVMPRGGGRWLRVGALDDCARCHRSAPREGLFGPP
ncbi:MAG TPA: hypothetical protein VFS43_42055 [Polyangiaceae bacterium]|nr:hypothetical protein [Polyangiaceae bacterium]